MKVGEKMSKCNSKKVSCECWKEWISKKAVANAGVVVVNSHNQALLLFKNQEWELPSGAIEKDEYPKIAAIRELREETQIELLEAELTELGTVTAFHPNYQQNKTDIIVTFIAFKNVKTTLSKEHSNDTWLSLERIDDPSIPMHPATRRQLWMAYEVVKARGYR